jgi:hypothetical protein
MRKRFGRIERALLLLLREHRDNPFQRTAIELAALIYKTRSAEVSAAQHAAVRRALNNLKRKGFVRSATGDARLSGTGRKAWMLIAEP